MFYEGLHGAVVTPDVNVAQHADLTIGVVPIINLEWIQTLHRDKDTRGYSTEAAVDTILRRMPDSVNYICPQFSQTHINFQRVPTVDTSNPFTARYIPAADESVGARCWKRVTRKSSALTRIFETSPAVRPRKACHGAAATHLLRDCRCR